MGTRNWKRCSDDKKKWSGKRHELESEWKQRRRMSAYRDGEFWIGNKQIPRRRPDREEDPEIGIFMNAASGKFEVWKDHRLLSSIKWKTHWRELILWAHRFGVGTGG